MKQLGPAWQLGSGLFGMPSREIMSQPPFPPDRSLGRRPAVDLFQRGTASDNILKWTLPHHCLVTVPVAMHTSQLGLRIQGRPHPEHHQLTRHVSYVCGGVVDGIQFRNSQREEDNQCTVWPNCILPVSL